MTNLSKICTFIFASVSLACFSVDQAHANLIVNGSFELPANSATSPFFTTYTSPSGAITGWTVASGSVDITNEDPVPPPNSFSWDAQDGTQSLDLNGTGSGSISQSFASTLGLLYRLTFYYANNPYINPSITPSMNVLIDGSPIATGITHTGSTAANMGWTQASFNILGTGNPMTLAFVSTSAGPSGITIDNVSVILPEPASMALLGIGSVGLAIGAIRRRRRSV